MMSASVARARSLGSERLSLVGLSCLCALAVLSLGGTPLWAGVLLGLLAAVFVTLAALAAPPNDRSLHPASAILLALAFFTLLQSLPVPVGVLAHLSPTAADVWSRSLLPAGDEVMWGAISLDPAASAVEAMKWATYACTLQLAVLSSRVGSSRGAVQVVVITGFAVALTSLIHQIVSAERVFGIYRPENDFRAHGVGPLLNPNHLAGYMNLAALAGLGWLVRGGNRGKLWMIGAGCATCIGVGLRTASLGGAVALALGLGVFFSLLLARWATRRSRPGFSVRLAVVAGAVTVLLGGALAVLGFDRKLQDELATPNATKLDMASWMPPLLRDFWTTGVGRGAFESAFEAYRPALGTNFVYSHPENIVIQWVSEWGVLGGLALLAMLWVFRPTQRYLRSPMSIGALAAATAIITQNLVDFSLELPGPAIALACCVAALVGRGTATAVERRRTRRPYWSLVPAVTVALTLAAVPRGSPTLPEARGQVRNLVSEPGNAEVAQGRIVAMMRRYPADYYFPMMGAYVSEAVGEDPTPWIQRALERGPNIGRVHLLLAHILQRRGAGKQAMLELRLAYQLEPLLVVEVANWALRWTHAPRELAAIVPDGPDGARLLDALVAEAERDGRHDLAASLDEQAFERRPESIPVRSRLMSRLLTKLERGACVAQDRCVEEIRRHATFLQEALRESPIGDIALARVAIVEHDEAHARDVLRAACRKPQSILDCLSLLAKIEEPNKLNALVARYVSLACTSRQACASADDWASTTYQNRRMWAQAYGAAVHAARTAPTGDRWRRAMELARNGGLTAEAEAAEEQLRRFEARRQ